MAKVNPRVSNPVQFLIDNKDTAKQWLENILNNWETMPVADLRQSLYRLAQINKQLILIVLSRRMGRVLLYFQQTSVVNGNTIHLIKYAVSEGEWGDFTHSTNIPLIPMVIDNDDGEDLTDPANSQAVNNRALFRSIKDSLGKIDVNGMPKYYIDTDGELAETDNWEEHNPVPPE